MGKPNLLHSCAVLPRRGGEAVPSNEICRPHETGEADREEREPVFPVRPALGAAAARACEGAVFVGVVAIALPADHATVAFARRALYDQSAECGFDARLTVEALVEQCGDVDRAVHEGREPMVVEDLETGGGEGERDRSKADSCL